MKVSKSWLKELVDLKVSEEELINLLPLRTIAINEVAPEYLELDMKGYNRADLLSMRGVAYEVAAITDSRVNFTETLQQDFVWEKDSLPQLNVLVEERELNPVYCLAKIEGLQVAPSPQNWVQKLSDSGMRSINNIADITNLVMIEFGQPLHSFDASQVKDEKIIVRRAREGEEIKTLDDKNRVLTTNDLLITDPDKALGIAGVMGGKNSEVTQSTTTILLEAAIFDAGTLRKTSMKLGLQSEASKRFYHGLTKKRLLQALDAAIKMYQDLGGKLTAISIVGEINESSKSVQLSLKKTQDLIGVDISSEKIEEFLKKLNFEMTPNGENTWDVMPSYYRLDVGIEEDLIEEVARMYGYENIPAKELRGDLPAKIDQSLFEKIYNLKTLLVKQGFTEIQTYSYFSTNVLKNMGLRENQENNLLIKIANPMSAETEYMRVSIWPNLLEKAAENLKYFKEIAIFEIGKTYKVTDGKIVEEYKLALAFVDNTENPLANLYQRLQKFPGISLAESDPNVKNMQFHPNRHAPLALNGQKSGGMAEIHSRILDKFGIEKRLAIAEIKLT